MSTKSKSAVVVTVTATTITDKILNNKKLSLGDKIVNLLAAMPGLNVRELAELVNANRKYGERKGKHHGDDVVRGALRKLDKAGVVTSVKEGEHWQGRRSWFAVAA